VTPQGHRYGALQAEFVVGLGVEAVLAGSMAAARGFDLAGVATPIGLGCRACFRHDCPQRSAAPMGRSLTINERERGVTALTFAGD
jgi:predicted transcriptional regulator